jgi:hypothetical protein
MTGRFIVSSTVMWISLKWIISYVQSPSCPTLGLFSTESAEYWPDTTSSWWACLTWKYIVSSGWSKTA